MFKLFISAFLVTAYSSMPQASQLQTTPQDSARAVKYFEEELEFTTNPYGVKLATEGKKGKAKIIDVRDPKTFAQGHIPGAVNVPFKDIEALLSSEGSSPLIKDGYNYVYCYENLCNLSQQACLKFAALGYPVKEMKGGFTGWKDYNYPVEK